MTVTDVDPAVWGERADGVSGLERELARVRRGRAAQSREQVVSIARAAVVNIVVVATRDVHAQRAARTISELAMRHPSRAIVVLADRHPDDATPPAIELHAQIPSVDQFEQVHYEQILVRARGRADDRLASVIVPLLVPDLPIFVWWTGTPPIGERLFEDLVTLADRLLVDSADFARPERMLPELARLCVLGPKHCALTDLNWARLTAWRELLTQFFDVPAWRALLPRIDGVRVSFAVDADGREVHPSQALLLIGWLAARLGWQPAERMAPSEAGGLLFAMRRADGARIRVRVRPRFELGMAEGDVTGVRVEGEAGGVRSEFRIHCGGRRYASLTVRQDGEVTAERIVPLPPTDVVELLGEELTILASDRIYEDALALLLTLS
ncbi:MAG TPA: glucose-6-phosphate dehydrogenase assembly protein OpcA [Candidatus Limnocylindria bacterium]